MTAAAIEVGAGRAAGAAATARGAGAAAGAAATAAATGRGAARRTPHSGTTPRATTGAAWTSPAAAGRRRRLRMFPAAPRPKTFIK